MSLFQLGVLQGTPSMGFQSYESAKRDRMLCYKSHLKRYQKTEIFHSGVSDHSGIKLEINMTSVKSLNNLLLKNPCVKQ